jgi:telomerase Cajal body protein 1
VWNLNDLNEDAFPKETQYKLHDDSCCGVSINPYLPVLATSSGQFKYFSNNNNDDENAEPEIVENSVVLWWIGDNGL